jgi:hypothetical protein
MKRYLTILSLAAAGVIALAQIGLGQAPGPKSPGPQPRNNPQSKNVPTVSIAFRNDLKSPIIVQGHSVVSGMQRRGQPVAVAAGKINFDNAVPAGVRYITVFDPSQPSRPLLQNVPIQVPPGRDLQVLIRTAPNNAKRIIIVPDNGQ